MATKPDSPLKKRFFKSFELFADISTAHGIRYVLHPNFTVTERLFWVVVLLSHASFASYVGFNLWLKFANAPIHNVIANIHYPLANLIFPAVTLCPANRINRTRGIEILNRYLNVTKVNQTVDLNPILNALTVMKYPSYFDMERHLEASRNYWNIFETLDLTDFFLQTLPGCAELLEECYWEGREIDCCELFSLQKTEEGFCYAFNSLTTKQDCKCPFGEEDVELRNSNNTCSYFHTSSTGSFSSLTVILKREDLPKDPVDENNMRGVLVLINSACEYPEAGSGALLETFPGQVLEVEITPVVFEAVSTIESISRDDRMCLFPGERRLSFYYHYSEHNCLLECRHKFITDSCKCQPPIFHDATLQYAPCSLPELMCISNLSSQGNIRKSATGGYCTQGQECPDCTCWPSCHRLQYNLRTRSNILTIFKGKERQGILDIHYSNLGAIKYQTQLTFTVEELLIAIGGTGSILMGASMISGTEILYYSLRGIYYSITKIGRKYRTKNNLPSESFAN